jgi:alkylated DNA repair dioxygenase AlkB
MIFFQSRWRKISTGKWGPWQRTELTNPRTRSALTQKSRQIHLPRGGTVTIYPGLLSKTQRATLSQELLSSNLFRQYEIQGMPEPRVHFLLHEQATDEPEAPQPGYRYGSVRMKACPLQGLPKLCRLSKIVGKRAGVESWNIGVNPVFYRDGKDRIGAHADDDQGESCILSVIVASPIPLRRLLIQPKPTKIVDRTVLGTKQKGNKRLKLKTGNGDIVDDGVDEQHELRLGPGDAYCMDGTWNRNDLYVLMRNKAFLNFFGTLWFTRIYWSGEMQEHYVHSLPPDEHSKGSVEGRRIIVVFRSGTQKVFKKDSGKPCNLAALEPRPDLCFTFGNEIKDLREGDIYGGRQLRAMNAHRSTQRSVSGNKVMGCDAITVSRDREDDTFVRFSFAAETRVGGGSMLTSLQKGYPVRVFRTSALHNKYKAVAKKSGPKSKSNVYRYDGLYHIESAVEELGDKVNDVSLGLSNMINRKSEIIFRLCRSSENSVSSMRLLRRIVIERMTHSKVTSNNDLRKNCPKKIIVN